MQEIEMKYKYIHMRKLRKMPQKYIKNSKSDQPW
jgi:hypothetical protein